MTGYSGTPLAKKLGIKPGSRLLAINAPADYSSLLEPLPQDVTFARADASDLEVVHLFTKTRAELTKLIGRNDEKTHEEFEPGRHYSGETANQGG
jgi:bifunctional DNA-binding transcriptional regulator/antitoxin component of YhaV-PrlF toxin-antitoxin module